MGNIKYRARPSIVSTREHSCQHEDDDDDFGADAVGVVLIPNVNRLLGIPPLDAYLFRAKAGW